jgi:hypothetical protein
MSDIKLDVNTGDLVFENGDLVLATGADAIAQHLKIRLRMFEGEWFLDPRQGLPYFRQILQKTPDVSSIGGIFRQAILETPGVESITRLDVELNRQTRALSINFTAKVDAGEELTFDEFIIEV